jgi:hypothetical protein
MIVHHWTLVELVLVVVEVSTTQSGTNKTAGNNFQDTKYISVHENNTTLLAVCQALW